MFPQAQLGSRRACLPPGPLSFPPFLPSHLFPSLFPFPFLFSPTPAFSSLPGLKSTTIEIHAKLQTRVYWNLYTGIRIRIRICMNYERSLYHTSHDSVSVVKTTFEVYGKVQTLTFSQPKTPEPIVTKFKWRDYVVDPYHQKIGLNSARGFCSPYR